MSVVRQTNRPQVLISQYDYEVRPQGLHDHVVRVQKRVDDDELRGRILHTVREYLLGNVKPLRVVECGTNVAGTLRTRRTHKELRNGKWRYRYEEIPATLEHVLSASLNRHDWEGQQFDSSGQRIQPFIRVCFHEGSQAELPFLEK